jgi:hypothetical protein
LVRYMYALALMMSEYTYLVIRILLNKM